MATVIIEVAQRDSAKTTAGDQGYWNIGPEDEYIQHWGEKYGKSKKATKAFDPSQPRYPEGHPLGGQWRDTNVANDIGKLQKMKHDLVSALGAFGSDVAGGGTSDSDDYAVQEQKLFKVMDAIKELEGHQPSAAKPAIAAVTLPTTKQEVLNVADAKYKKLNNESYTWGADVAAGKMTEAEYKIKWQAKEDAYNEVLRIDKLTDADFKPKPVKPVSTVKPKPTKVVKISFDDTHAGTANKDMSLYALDNRVQDETTSKLSKLWETDNTGETIDPLADTDQADLKIYISKTYAERRSDIPQAEEQMGQIVEAWSDSSNNSYSSLGLQRAAAKMSGGKLSSWQTEGAGQFMEPNSNEGEFEGGVDFDAIAQDMYRETQAWFTRNGFKPTDTITVYRGFSTDNESKFGKAIIKEGIGLKADFTMNPLESWTHNSFTAEQFAINNSGEHYTGAVVAMDIPVSRVFATPFTGVGCWGESELVLVSTPKVRDTAVVVGTSKTFQRF